MNWYVLDQLMQMVVKCQLRACIMSLMLLAKAIARLLAVPIRCLVGEEQTEGVVKCQKPAFLPRDQLALTETHVLGYVQHFVVKMKLNALEK